MGPLTMQGTVLSEDWGHLTDILENADSAMSHTLYQDTRTANLLGRAHLHYRELSYEQARETFERCYSYSNCLITYMEIWITGPYCIFWTESISPERRQKARSLLGEFEEPVNQVFAPAQHRVPLTRAVPRNTPLSWTTVSTCRTVQKRNSYTGTCLRISWITIPLPGTGMPGKWESTM